MPSTQLLRAVRITTADTVLEPSAGTGLLAVFAARAGAKLVLNEIDPARADMLQAAFPTAPVSRHDGELIDDLLPLSIRPTAVLINPPFSRSIVSSDEHTSELQLQMR